MTIPHHAPNPIFIGLRATLCGIVGPRLMATEEKQANCLNCIRVMRKMRREGTLDIIRDTVRVTSMSVGCHIRFITEKPEELSKRLLALGFSSEGKAHQNIRNGDWIERDPLHPKHIYKLIITVEDLGARS